MNTEAKLLHMDDPRSMICKPTELLREIGTDLSVRLGKTEYERDRALSALRILVRKGTGGRYYTSQHGDTDVTNFVAAALDAR